MKIKAWGVFINTGDDKEKIKGYKWALGIYATKRYAKSAAKEEVGGKYIVIPVIINYKTKK